MRDWIRQNYLFLVCIFLILCIISGGYVFHKKIVALENTVSDLESALGSSGYDLESKISEIESSINDLSYKIDSLESDVNEIDDIQSAVDELESEVRSIRLRLPY